MASDRRTHSRTLACALLVTSLALSSLAHADPTAADRETARSLMDDADKKYEQKDYQGALKSYQAAHSIMGVPTTGLELGKAQETLGLLVEARDTYGEVARYPTKPGESDAFTKARAEASRRVAKLSSKIPSFHLTVSGPPAGAALDVKVDGEQVPAAAATLPRRANPGNHTVTASAPGFSESSADIILKEGETRELKLSLVAGAAPPRAVVAQPPAAAPPSYGAPPPQGWGPGAPGAPASYYQPAPEMRRRSTGLFITGIILMPVGGIVAIAGGVVALGGTAVAGASCGGIYSSNTSCASNSDAQTTGGIIAAVGGVVLVGGIVMLVVGNHKVRVKEPASSASIEPLLSPGQTGFRVRF